MAGRVLIVLMFLSLFKFDSVLRLIFEIVGLGTLRARHRGPPLTLCVASTALVALVTVGMKTKLSALVLIVLLMLQNLIFNAFWMEWQNSNAYDFKKSVVCKKKKKNKKKKKKKKREMK